MKRGLVDAAPPKTLWFPISIASDEVWVVSVSYFIFHLPALFFVFFVMLSMLDILKIYNCDIVDDIIEDPHRLFMILTFCHLLINHILWFWTYWVSTSGDIFQGHKRKYINVPISILLPHGILMIPLTLLGISALATFEYEALDLDVQECDAYSESQLILLVFVMIGLLIDVICFLISAFTFIDFFGNEKTRRRRSSSVDTEIEFNDRKDFWHRRCRTWCFTMKLLSCGCFGGVKKGERGDFAFNQISDVFGTWFTGHDSGLSDLITALLLLRAEEQSKNRKEVVNIYKSSSKDFDFDTSKKRNLSAELVDFLETEDTVRKYKRRVGSVYRNIFDDEAEVVDELDTRRTKVKRQESVDLKKDAKKKIKEVGVTPEFEVKRTALELEVNSKNLFLLKLFSDYRSYMMGLYGWKLLVYMDAISLRPLRNIGKILGFSKPSSPKKMFFRDQTRPRKKKCCSSNANALMAQTNLVSEHLVYASYASVEGLVVPYAVMIDHELKSVIVGCRGTMSLNDLVTDAMIHPAPLKTLGEQWNFDGKDRYAHHGMLCCASEIRKQLQQTQILHRLLKKEPRSEVEAEDVDDEELLKNLNIDIEDMPDCSGYNLVLLGHSLGAGVASLLALLLKNEFDLLASAEPPKEGEVFENRFFCLAYAVPGCMMDEELSKRCEDFILSPVIGRDVIPHLSWLTLQKLRLKSLDALYRSRASRKVIFSTTYKHVPNAKLFYARSEVPKTPARLKLKKQIEKLARRVLVVEEAAKEGEVVDEEEIDKKLIERKVMQCPGRVVHFASLFSKSKRCSCLSQEKEFKVYDVERDDFIDVSISLRFVLDHFPNYYSEVIEKTYKQFREEFDGELNDHQSSVALSVGGKTI